MAWSAHSLPLTLPAGNGGIVRAMQLRGKSALGIELSQAVLERDAMDLLKAGRVEQGSLTDLPYQGAAQRDAGALVAAVCTAFPPALRLACGSLHHCCLCCSSWHLVCPVPQTSSLTWCSAPTCLSIYCRSRWVPRRGLPLAVAALHAQPAKSCPSIPHVPQADAVVSELVRVAKRHIVLSISLKSYENVKLHSLLRPRHWWEAKFEQHGVKTNRALVWALQQKENRRAASMWARRFMGDYDEMR